MQIQIRPRFGIVNFMNAFLKLKKQQINCLNKSGKFFNKLNIILKVKSSKYILVLVICSFTPGLINNRMQKSKYV